MAKKQAKSQAQKEQDAFSLQILQALTEAATKVAASITAKVPGRYTAAELARDKNALGEDIRVNWSPVEEIKITVGAFSCSTTTSEVFADMQKFEKICNVRGSQKTHFVIAAADETAKAEEIVKGKAVIPILGRENKWTTTRKTLAIKVLLTGLGAGADCLGMDKKGGSYYKHGGAWYLMTDFGSITGFLKDNPDAVYIRLEKFDYEANAGGKYTRVYAELYAAMKAEREAAGGTATDAAGATSDGTKAVAEISDTPDAANADRPCCNGNAHGYVPTPGTQPNRGGIRAATRPGHCVFWIKSRPSPQRAFLELKRGPTPVRFFGTATGRAVTGRPCAPPMQDRSGLAPPWRFLEEKNGGIPLWHFLKQHTGHESKKHHTA